MIKIHILVVLLFVLEHIGTLSLSMLESEVVSPLLCERYEANFTHVDFYHTLNYFYHIY